MNQPNNLIKYVETAINTIFPPTVNFLILYLLGFYILLLTFKVNPWLSIVGAIAFTFASYNFIIIAAGHNSKAYTIAYMAPLIGSVFSAFRYNRIGGALLTAIFLSLAIKANHIQILYYTLFILLFFAVVELIYSIKDKKIGDYLKSSGVVLIAVIIAVGMNATSLLTTYEYSKYTMRGDSNGLTDKANAQNGLSSDYITQWSYGVDESFTMLIPDFKGGASSGTLGVDSETAKTIKEKYNVPNLKKTMDEYPLPLYWGSQPFTSGPVYLGAIVIFLFVLSLFLLEKRTLWWLVPTILLTLMLSWGKNMMWLTDFFIQHVPMYQKFRTVSMTLVATGFAIALMALLALKEIFNKDFKRENLIKPLYISTGITAGIALVFALIPSLAGNFTSPADAQFTGDMAFLQDTLIADRTALLRADALRSALFIIAAAAILWMYVKNFFKSSLAIALIGVLLILDMAPVAYRYLNDKNFERKRNFSNLVQPSNADNMILQDKSDYRVMDVTVNVFSDAQPSYFHKNVGGYHAAKLRRYQELIDKQLDPEIGKLFAVFGKAKTFDEILPVFDSLGVLNMMNTKYIIYNKDAAPLLNTKANGNAWLVNNIVIADNADQEMALVGKINTKNEVVVDKTFKAELPAAIEKDTSASIALKSYKPNDLVYTFKSAKNQFAVFSEIYYDKGWNAYINGNKVPYVRANYLLRAMPLKAGAYDVEFKFEPKSYATGNILALISSLILLISIVTFGIFKLKKK